MNFLLRKWYCDILTQNRVYLFVYFAYFRLLGRTMRSLTLHCARPGAPPVTRSFAVAHHSEHHDARSRCVLRIPEGEITVAGRECLVALSRGDCTVHLRYSSAEKFSGTPVSISTGGRSRILWTPIGLKYLVSGTATVGGETVVVKDADGYADFLESTYLPPRVPVRTLYWGRIHHPRIDCVYMHASGNRRDQIWSKLFVRTRDRMLEGGPATIVPLTPLLSAGTDGITPGTYDVGSETGAGRVSIRIRRISAVQSQGFVDQQDIRSKIASSLLKVLTRNPRSTKYLSRAEISLEGGTHPVRVRDVPVIEEYALL